MFRKYIPRITVVMLGVLIVLGATNAIAAGNTVSSSRLDEQNTALTANNKKPAACSALTLTSIVQCPTSGGGICTGTKNSELILGTVGVDIITGKGGTDCILGGDNNDTINGNAGGDICIGGPGHDTFNKCETIPDLEPGE
jgi:Ca2+-binding RTX toxin-like protein